MGRWKDFYEKKLRLGAGVGETLDIMKNDSAAYYLFVEKKIIILKHFRISRKTEQKFYEISIVRLTRVKLMFPLEFSILREK